MAPQVIPLRNLPPQQRNANGNVLQALPRVDTESELEYQDPYQTLPTEVQDLLVKHQDQKISVEGDKIIINGHIHKYFVVVFNDVYPTLTTLYILQYLLCI